MDPAALRDPGRCPDCAAVLPPEPVACPACGLPLRGPLVDRLWRLSLQAAQTLEQRQSVIDALRGRTDSVPTGPGNAAWGDTPITVASGPPPAGAGLAPPRPWAPDDTRSADAAWQGGPREEPHRERVSPRQIQHLLLGLGVLLLAVAALIFVVVAWGRLDTGGRTAILAGVTVASAAGSRLALRRELSSTAEALAVLTVALLLLDAWGVREYEFLGAGDTAGDLYWASVLGALAAGALLVSRALPLRTPVWVAAIAVQLPVPVLSERLGAVGTCSALVLQGTAALALLQRSGAVEPTEDDTDDRPSRRRVRTDRRKGIPDLAFLIGGLVAWVVGAVGIALLAYDQLDEENVSNAGGVALLLLAAAAASFLAWDRRAVVWLSTPAAAVATAAVLAAGHAPLERSLDHDVATAAAVAILMVVSMLVAAVPDNALGEITPQLRLGPLAVLATAAALAALDVAEPVGEALGGAFRHVSDPWQHSLDADALERLGEPWPFHGAVGFSVVLLTAAAALLAHRLRNTAPGVVAGAGAAFGAIATVLVVPIAIRAPYLLAVLSMMVLGAAMLLLAARLLPAEATDGSDGEPEWSDHDRQMGAVLVVGGAAAVTTGLAWSLASSAATAWALAALCAAALGGRAALPAAGRARATALAAASLIAEVGVLARIADASVPAAGTAAIAAATVLAVAARLVPDPTERITLEVTCLLAAVCAGPTLGEDAHWASIALLIAGVGAAAVAMDPRRRLVGWLSGALLTGSTWLRLGDADVSTPEAYTLPPAVALLIYGALAHRRNRELISWRTYGPGLMLGLIPSLLVTFGDDGLARPLLLGLAALLVLLAGVAGRLQAPLALGGVTLGVDAVVQIAPYVDAVPRWVSIGAAGILLLTLGATFERRLRDARKLAERFAALG